MSKQLNKHEVIDLINKMRELNQTEQARATYALAHKTYPEWRLDEVAWIKKEIHE